MDTSKANPFEKNGKHPGKLTRQPQKYEATLLGRQRTGPRLTYLRRCENKASQLKRHGKHIGLRHRMSANKLLFRYVYLYGFIFLLFILWMGKIAFFGLWCFMICLWNLYAFFMVQFMIFFDFNLLFWLCLIVFLLLKSFEPIQNIATEVFNLTCSFSIYIY